MSVIRRDGLIFDRKGRKQQHKRKPSKISSSENREFLEGRVQNLERAEKSAKS